MKILYPKYDKNNSQTIGRRDMGIFKKKNPLDHQIYAVKESPKKLES